MHDAAAARVLITAAALVPLAIWIYLLLARGAFWRVSKNLAPPCQLPPGNKKIAVVIPARNEEQVIAETIQSIVSQRWTADLHVFVVDDNSSDNTAEAARTAAQHSVTVLTGKPLPPGWTGKLWALSQGVAKALELNPDFLLFTDADIRHDPENLKTLVSIAESRGCDLTSFMVKLSCGTIPEKMLIPAFVFFFFQLYPPQWIHSPAKQTAGAAGGCVLIRPSALLRIGGLATIRGEVIDDCALARAVKKTGGRAWLGLTPLTHSTRVYSSFHEVGAMIARTAFNQLRHSSLLLIGTILGLLITYVLPIALLFSGAVIPELLGTITCLLMITAYLPMIRFYALPWVWVLALPFAAVFYLGATVLSALRYWSGTGGRWKGRDQDIRSL